MAGIERKQLRVISTEGEPPAHVACGEVSEFSDLFCLPSKKKGIVRGKLFRRNVFCPLDADPEGEEQNTQKEHCGADVFEKWISAEGFPVICP
jgi:hypothetical protein